MAIPKKGEIPELGDVGVWGLLKRPEDELFDRTLGGQDNIGKKIAGFGTKNGGTLLVGQDDLAKGGGVVGIDEEEFQRDFSNALSNVKPTPLTQQRIVKVGGKKIVLVRVQDIGTSRPCSYNGTYYERKGSTTPRLGPDEVKRYHLLYGSSISEDIPTHARKGDVDESEVIVYSSLLGKSKENVLRTVTTPNGFLTVRGAVVLSRRPDEHLEGAFIEIQRYENFMGSAPKPVGPSLKLSRPARQLIEEAAKIVEQNLPVTRVYEGARMIQAPAIPPSIIREAVTNAVAHRNYRSHEHILVRIYPDGFDISNPAVITERMWADIVANHTTYHPNEGIYTFLNPARLYEGRGEGIWKIREELHRLGKAAPEFKVFGEGPSSFYARISLAPAKAKDVKRKKLADALASKKAVTTSEVMKLLHISRVTAIRMLDELAEQGLVERHGAGRNSRYLVRIAHNPKGEDAPTKAL